jgi:transposase
MKAITEKQYQFLHPHLPVQRGNVSISNLDLINAVLYVAENGCKWRCLPPEFGKWHTVYTRIRRWAENGVLDRLFVALQAHQLIHINVECLGLDSTSIKVHPDGTGALKKTVRNQSGNREAGGQQKFIWLPRMIDAP